MQSALTTNQATLAGVTESFRQLNSCPKYLWHKLLFNGLTVETIAGCGQGKSPHQRSGVVSNGHGDRADILRELAFIDGVTSLDNFTHLLPEEFGIGNSFCRVALQ